MLFCWMAAAVSKRESSGDNDEIGFHAVENRHYVTDIHATIMHSWGLDSRRLEMPGSKTFDIDHGTPIPRSLRSRLSQRFYSDRSSCRPRFLFVLGAVVACLRQYRVSDGVAWSNTQPKRLERLNVQQSGV